MAQEIENYLLEKLSKDLESSKVPLAKEFKVLNDLMREKITTCSSLDISSLRAQLYSLNDIFTDCLALSGKHTFFSPSLNKIKKNLSKIKTEIENIKPSNNNQNANPTQINAQPTSSSGNRQLSQSKIYGFDEEILYLQKWLVQQSSINYFKTIGIVGLAGVGKTTLCQLLLAKTEVKNYFVPRIWVHMSEIADEDNDPKIATVKKILNLLGVEEKMVKSILDENGLAGLICAVHVELMRKRYLIVLDDVNEGCDWFSNLNASLPSQVKWEERLAYALPKGYGGTVIVTSRSVELMKMMIGGDNIHRVLPLANKDLCWDIFRDEIEMEIKPFLPFHEEELKREVINKCGGVPLAAKMMGQIVREGIKEGSVPIQTIQTQQSTDNNSIAQ